MNSEQTNPKPRIQLPKDQHEILVKTRQSLAALKRRKFYTMDDMESVSASIESLDKMYMVQFMEGTIPELDEVMVMMFRMCFSLGNLDGDLMPVYNKLCRIKSGLLSLKHQGAYTAEDVTHLQRELHGVDGLIEDGRIVRSETGEPLVQDGSIPPGQALVFNLLHGCHRLATHLLEGTEIHPALAHVEAAVTSVFKEAELLARRARTEVITVPVIQALQDHIRAADTRVGGRFVIDGKTPPGQAALVAMLEKAYTAAHDLLAIHEAEADLVSPHLKPLFNELSSILADLQALAALTINITPAAVATLQQRLHRVEERRTCSGIFYASDGQTAIVEGQAVLHYMLARCYGLVHDLLSYSEPLLHYDDTSALNLRLVNIRSRLRSLKNTPGAPTGPAQVQALERELDEVVLLLTEHGLVRVGMKGLETPDSPNGGKLRCYLLEECYELLFDQIGRLPSYTK